MTHIVSPATTSTARTSLPRVAAQLDVDAGLGHHRGHRRADTSSGRSMPATRSRPCRSSDAKKVSPCARASLRGGRRQAARLRSRPSRPPPIPACRPSSRTSCRSRDRPELTSAKIVVSGGRGARLGEKFQPVIDAAGRQARRRRRRQPRRGRCRLRPERLAGRPDRQGRRAATSTSPSASRAPSSTSPA